MHAHARLLKACTRDSARDSARATPDCLASLAWWCPVAHREVFARTPEGSVLGAFGSDSENRNSLVPVAMAKYEQAFGQPLQPWEVLVIGDTPRDIECAQIHEARSLAVATGEYGIEELAAADWAVPDLRDTASILSLIAGEGGSVE